MKSKFPKVFEIRTAHFVALNCPLISLTGLMNSSFSIHDPSVVESFSNFACNGTAMLLLVFAGVWCEFKKFFYLSTFTLRTPVVPRPSSLSDCRHTPTFVNRRLFPSPSPYYLKTVPITLAIAGTVADSCEQLWHWQWWWRSKSDRFLRAVLDVLKNTEGWSAVVSRACDLILSVCCLYLSWTVHKCMLCLSVLNCA